MNALTSAWRSARARGLQWPLAIVTLIGLNMTIVFITVALATSDKSVAVEPDYYRKAVDWDETARAQEASRKLGWHVDSRIDFSSAAPQLILTVTDAAGKPLSGVQIEVETFASLRSGDRQTLQLKPASLGTGEPTGVYSAPIVIHQPGLWQIRVTCRRGDDTFLTESTANVDAARAPVGSGTAGK